METLITADNIRTIDTYGRYTRNIAQANKADVMNLKAFQVNAIQELTWDTVYSGYNYLNTGSTVTLNLKSGATLADVKELRMVFSAYDTDTDKVIDGNCYTYSMSNISNDFDGFYSSQNIAYPKGNAEGTSWQDFFYIKSFNLNAPNKIEGQGTTQTDGGNHASVLRTVMVQYYEL